MPSAKKIAIRTTAINEAMRPYSIAVTPRLSAQNLQNSVAVGDIGEIILLAFRLQVVSVAGGRERHAGSTVVARCC